MARRATVGLLLLVALGLAQHAVAGPEDPRPFPEDTEISDSLPEITAVHNYELVIDPNRSQDDVLFSFSWESGLPWFLVKCGTKPSIFPFDATWFVRPQRGSTVAQLELPNHQCFNSSALWLKVYAFNPTINYKMSFSLLGTRTTSLATGYRPMLFSGGNSTEVVSYNRVPVYKIEVPPAFRKSIISKFEVFGSKGNSISRCFLAMKLYSLRGDRLELLDSGSGGCSAFSEGRLVGSYAPFQLSETDTHVYLAVEASNSGFNGPPSLVGTPPGHNLAQQAFTVHKRRNGDVLPSSFSVSHLSRSSHPGYAVSFDFSKPQVLDIASNPVHIVKANIGALSWHYYSVDVKAPMMIEFSYDSETDSDMIAVFTHDSAIPSERRRNAQIPNVHEAQSKPLHHWFTQNRKVVIGIRGNSKEVLHRPFAMTVVANPAVPIAAFDITPGTVEAGRWKFFSSSLRRVARVQVPIRTQVEGVELFVSPGLYPTRSSVMAKPTDKPGVKCAELELTGDGDFYIGVAGVGVVGSGSSGSEAPFEIQLILNGFGPCEFSE